MDNWLQVPAIRTVTQRESRQRDSYYGLFEAMQVEGGAASSVRFPGSDRINP